jgi:peptide/nickel transport system substrate-binding protein
MKKVLPSKSQAISRRHMLAVLSAGGLALSFTDRAEPTAPAQNVMAAAGPLPNTLTWVLPAPVNTLDPAYANIQANTVHTLGYESLLLYGSDGALHPQLAESWSQTGLLTYVYKLRHDVKFWDGTPLTPDDVVYSFKRIMDPKTASGWAFFFTRVHSVNVTGPNEVTIKLNEPDPLFRFVPGMAGSRIISKKMGEAHPKDYGTAADFTMGTGPYRFTSFSHDQSVTAERNERYWGGKPRFKTVDVKFIVDQSTAQLAMRSGQIDGIFYVSLDQIKAWQSTGRANVVSAPGLFVAYFSFDTQVPPWNDVHVRRACAHAIDRRGLVHSVLDDRGEPAVALAMPQQWTGLLDSSQVRQLYSGLDRYSFDLKAAKQELAESSVPNGFTATINYPDAVKALGLAALNLSQNLSQIGVTLNVKEIPFLQWKSQTAEHQGGINVFFWSATTTDAAEELQLFLDSQYAVPRSFNYANYKNPQVDQLLRQQRTSRNPGARAQALADILKVAATDLPYLPVWYQDIAMAVKSSYQFDTFSAWFKWQDWPDRIKSR